MDELTRDLIELRELRAAKKNWEASDLARKLIVQVARKATARFGHTVFHPALDENYQNLPFETRIRSEKAFKAIEDEEQERATQAQKDAERVARHEKFLAEKAAKRDAEVKRVNDNWAQYHDLLPESLAGFHALQDERKSMLLGLLGGRYLLDEYVRKEATGMTWSSYLRLQNFDKNAKPAETASNGDEDTPPKDNGGKPVTAPAAD